MTAKLLIGLDATHMDTMLVQQAVFYCRHLPVSKVVFLHVVASEQIPRRLRSAYDYLSPMPEDVARKRIEECLQQHFVASETPDYELVIEHGNITEMMLVKARDTRADLLVLGKKVDQPGQGISSSRMAQMAPCPVVFIPETAPQQMHRILVPVDFSEHAAMALQEAYAWGRSFGAQVICHHVIGLPSTYYPYIPSDKVERELVEDAQNRYKVFLEKNGIDENTPCHFTIGRMDNPAHDVYAHAQREGAHLIAIGARGRTPAASFVLGSLAARLAYAPYAIPILVHKSQNERLGLLKALKERLF